ncbi:MAG TPA: glycosyltransferase family 4 protein [Dehalococcoidia bacterium]|nr:glycosyltransferase family 4 protein [Dehalococcoidia bacterium]
MATVLERPRAAEIARRPLRLLVVTANCFPHMGGIETHVYEVSRRLVRDGVDVTVLTTDASHTLPAAEAIDGVQVRRVPAWPAHRDYYFAPGIYRTLGEGSWDLVHVQGCHTLVPPLAMLAARRAGIPYIVTFHTGGHSSRLRQALRGAQWAALGPLLRRADRLIGVSRFEAELFRRRLRLPASRFAVIQNGAELPDPGPAAAPPQNDAPLIVSFGRLERYKGHQRAVQALPLLRERLPGARLLILGSGPYECELRRLAARLGVARAVEITSIPPAERGRLAATLRRASLVTLLSEYEAHPVAVMEAAALQRPVLVADTSGLRELAERGLARAVPLHSSPAALAEAMAQQLDRPAAATPALPTWDGCSRRLLALYRDVLEERPCAS